MMKARVSTHSIAISGVSKRHKSTLAVDDLTMNIVRGTTFGILGPDGAGKTTLVEMIAGLRKPDSGSISVFGLDSRRDRATLRQILGIQLENAHLHHSLTVRELVDLYRGFYPSPREVDETLELVQLSDQHDSQFDELSDDQRKRLSLALALVSKPQLVILDELTTGMDPVVRRDMWATLEELSAEGVTIILVSHTLSEVERLCDRVAILNDGQILAKGTPGLVREKTGADSLADAFVSLTGAAMYESEEGS